MPKNMQMDNGGLSPVGKIIGHIALAIILAVMLWTGKTAQVNDRLLHVLKQKVDQFQARYHIEKEKENKRLERLEEKMDKQFQRQSFDGPQPYFERQPYRR